MASLISVQLNSGSDVNANLNKIAELVEQACLKADNERLVVLPECCSLFGVSGKVMLSHAEHEHYGNVQKSLSQIARDNNTYLVAGTIPIIAMEASNKNSAINNKYCAASIVYGPDGKQIARYDKIHLFDVVVDDSTKNYQESLYTQAGTHLSLFNCGFTDVGQSVCYDLRFPALFNAYSECHPQNFAPQLIVVPSAFTYKTGNAHWHALLQARSIENQSFVVASNQTGMHPDGRQTFGNSCIYSPWGECLSMIEEEVGYAMADFDLQLLKRVRANMPIHAHKKERYQIESQGS